MNASLVHPFAGIQRVPVDPIFGLFQTFQADSRSRKINLGIGMYYDEQGTLPVLDSVRQAQAGSSGDASSYLPMRGYSAYCHQAQRLVFGDGFDSSCVATIQTLGGTGALRIGAEVLRQHCQAAEIWIADPGWENHQAIFSSAGYQVRRYPYLSSDGKGIDFEAMLGCLGNLPAHTIILLHACCHNPSGVDLSPLQWQVLADLFKNRRLIPFLDFAYQGFGSGIDDDAWAVRFLAREGIPFLVASSFSKNFALYSQRCGVLSAFCLNRLHADRLLSHMEYAVRCSYSNPPVHGASIIARVLASDALYTLWRSEVDQMRDRIGRMREGLIDRLSATGMSAEVDFSHLRSGRGMFLLSGLSPAQVNWLRSHCGIYLVENGRLCLAGLNETNVDEVAQAIREAFLAAGEAV